MDIDQELDMADNQASKRIIDEYDATRADGYSSESNARLKRRIIVVLRQHKETIGRICARYTKKERVENEL